MPSCDCCLGAGLGLYLASPIPMQSASAARQGGNKVTKHCSTHRLPLSLQSNRVSVQNALLFDSIHQQLCTRGTTPRRALPFPRCSMPCMPLPVTGSSVSTQPDPPYSHQRGTTFAA